MNNNDLSENEKGFQVGELISGENEEIQADYAQFKDAKAAAKTLLDEQLASVSSKLNPEAKGVFDKMEDVYNNKDLTKAEADEQIQTIQTETVDKEATKDASAAFSSNFFNRS
uniref:DUF148 domain-containing protein n=1 Tax=Rhabditophanes sp. KR3021 TaxID=114890 RepID=A0AC35UCW0_9BILA